MKRTLLSPRLQEFIDALPVKPNMRVLEIGCGTGAAARELVAKLDTGFVLAIDRSPKAIAIAESNSKKEIQSGKLEFRCVAVEDLILNPAEPLFDIAFAVRVGALDGRHPQLGTRAFPRIADTLKKSAKLFIDGGSPLQEIDLQSYR